jgi:phage terminase large subunit
VKSFEGFGRAWVEEAQSLSSGSLPLLRPTIRAAGSQTWFSWNPRRKSDPVEGMLRGPALPTGAMVVRASWSDKSMAARRARAGAAGLPSHRARSLRPYPGGRYATVLKGPLCGSACRDQAHPPHRPAWPRSAAAAQAFWDIGVRDATSIWIAQFVGRKAVRQPLAAHEVEGKLDTSVTFITTYEERKIP